MKSKSLWIFPLVALLALATSAFTPANLLGAGRTTVPNTLLSLELEDELEDFEPDPDEPAEELDEKFEDSRKEYMFFTESGLFGSITVTELKPAGGFLPWLLYFEAQTEQLKLDPEEEIPGIKVELIKSERWRFGKRFAAFSHVNTTVEGETLGSMTLAVGGKGEVITIDILVDATNKSQIEEARHILESVVYEGESPSRIEVTFPNDK